MKKILKITTLIICLLFVGFLIIFFGFVPNYIANSMNQVINKPPYTVSEKAKQLHEKLFVADLHADSLLWKRDLNQKDTVGQVDIPRMFEGNVALQAFTVVTKSPKGLNIENNDDKTDNIFWLAPFGNATAGKSFKFDQTRNLASEKTSSVCRKFKRKIRCHQNKKRFAKFFGTPKD